MYNAHLSCMIETIMCYEELFSNFVIAGNDAIHVLTKDTKQILRIDLMKFSREKGHAMYSSFFVDNEANKYKLKLGSFNGTKGVGMLNVNCCSL